MHAQKGPSEAPRTCFRACKTSKFSGGVPPDPPCTMAILWAPLLYLPWAPPILSAALVSPQQGNILFLIYRPHRLPDTIVWHFWNTIHFWTVFLRLCFVNSACAHPHWFSVISRMRNKMFPCYCLIPVHRHFIQPKSLHFRREESGSVFSASVCIMQATKCCVEYLPLALKDRRSCFSQGERFAVQLPLERTVALRK